ncbi:MAG: N-acetyl-alpha-D-glucosaminyl L-malate synthase BshA [Bacteroidetes bacterium]|jgi:N-acetyl-alpha-D-glucosaminyl L-malate synthase BshA|nr:N-acetyl-alpha-D-glucosaminyl L-malate synthase BshA [Bacteroidota bacterium]
MVCYPTYGGSGVLATELGKALAQRGHTVHFITYKRPVRLEGFNEHVFYHEVYAEDYPVFDFLPYESALTSRIVDVARYEQLDVLHVHYAVPHASAAYLAHQILKSMGQYLPIVTTLHGTDITLVGKEASYEPVVTYSINQSHGVTAVSHYLKQATYENFEIKRDIEVIHNFVDLARFRSNRAENKLRQVLSPCGNTRVLMHVSNFRPVKRVHDVLSLFARLRKELPSKLVFVGDGPERPGLERRVREEHLSCDVLFLGKQEAVEDILPAGDLFCIPSEQESFGLSALEAMACGMPVLASHVGGLPEVVADGISGRLAPVGDLDAMLEGALDILADDARLVDYRLAAYARAQTFSLPFIVNQYEACYFRAASLAAVPSPS